jgi:hypothetical protein
LASRRSFGFLDKTFGKVAPSSGGCFIVQLGYRKLEETRPEWGKDCSMQLAALGLVRSLIIPVDEMVLNDPS